PCRVADVDVRLCVIGYPLLRFAVARDPPDIPHAVALTGEGYLVAARGPAPGPALPALESQLLIRAGARPGARDNGDVRVIAAFYFKSQILAIGRPAGKSHHLLIEGQLLCRPVSERKCPDVDRAAGSGIECELASVWSQPSHPQVYILVAEQRLFAAVHINFQKLTSPCVFTPERDMTARRQPTQH